MTPYDPQAIAREAAEQIMALNYPTTPAIDNLSGIILTAAARMVKESGAVEALKEADYYASASAPYRNGKQGLVAAALANLAKLEGRG